MSLKVWLPLNGDLHNQGCSDINFTNSNAAIDDNGKIGKCYYFNGSSYLSAPSPEGIKSVCFWIKTTVTASKVAFADYKSKLGFGFNASKYMIVTCSGFAIQMYTNYSAVVNDQWTHVAIVKLEDDSDVLLYINGILQTARGSTNNWTHSSDTMMLGKRSTGSNMTCYINDFRAYDHCLSAAEVREISQGLVLHYKLSANNLINKSTLTANSYINASGELTGTGGWFASDYIPITPGCVYQTFDLSHGGSNTRIAFYDINKTYKRNVTIVANENLTLTAAEEEAYMRVSIRNLANELQIASIVEVPNIIEDSSGYRHTGTPYDADNISLSADTPRYNSSTNFSSSLSAINVGRDLYINSSLTYNCWIKSDAANKSRGILSCIQSRGVGFKTDTSKLYFTASIDGTWQSAYATTSLSNICNNNWHMITGVIDKEESTTKIYVDGALQATTNYTGTDVVYNTSTVLWVGAEAKTALATPDAGWEGQMSDVRIYCTALSAEDILSLYHTGAKVDNKQNFHTFELIENNSTIQINKRGQTLCNELEEDAATKFYKTNQIIETNEIIES